MNKNFITSTKGSAPETFEKSGFISPYMDEHLSNNYVALYKCRINLKRFINHGRMRAMYYHRGKICVNCVTDPVTGQSNIGIQLKKYI